MGKKRVVKAKKSPPAPTRPRRQGKRPAPPRPVGEAERIAERRLRSLQLRKAGLYYKAIAKQLTEDRAKAYATLHDVSIERARKKVLGVSVRTAWDDVNAELAELRQETETERASLVALENARIDMVYQKALKEFVSNSNIEAGRLVAKMMERRAKLNGLDAPTKIAPTDPSGEHPADTGVINVNTLSEDTLRRVLRDEKRDQDA